MEDEFITLELASIILKVPPEILEAAAREIGNSLTFKSENGERLYLLDELARLRDGDPTFGGRRATQVEIAPALPLFRKIANRREAVTVFVNATAAAALAIVGTAPLVAKITLSEEESRTAARDAEVARRLFGELFGRIDSEWSYDLGDPYPHGGYHRDHTAACTGLFGDMVRITDLGKRVRTRLPINTSIAEDLVVIGGPLSTSFVRSAWQYEKFGSGYCRDDNPLLPIPYSFLVDPTDSRMATMQMNPTGWIAADGTPLKSYIRPVVDLADANGLWEPPRLSSQEFVDVDGQKVPVPLSNDLLITRVPNFLSAKYEIDRGRHPVAWGKLVVIQATNGIGTRAVRLLLSNRGRYALEGLREQVSNSIAFQAHFEVSDPIVGSGGTHEFSDISFRRASVIDQAKIPLSNYLLARNIVINKHGIEI